MSLLRITPDDIEFFTLETNPKYTFSSSSVDGVNGEIYVFPRRSNRLKEVRPLEIFSQSLYNDKDLDLELQAIVKEAKNTTNIQTIMLQYLRDVNSQPISARLNEKVSIIRFTPPVRFTKDTGRKLTVINTLMKYYRCSYPESHFAFTNYHSLNFFTASTVPTGSALLYPNIYNQYNLSSSFSFDFWINPRYTTDLPNNLSPFNAATLLHLSGCYAISLVTGSSKDINGFPDKYRILLQVYDGTNIPPSTININSALPPYVFLSDDNALERNKWHHVTIRWQKNVNNDYGEFIVDNKNKGSFSLNVNSILSTGATPKVLVVGNYYEGTNTGVNSQDFFFSTNISQRDGLVELINSTQENPSVFYFRHPFNAEVHDIKIYNKFLNDKEIQYLYSNGPSGSLLDNLIFYLPPFFTPESPYRRYVGTHGGILYTPFESKDGTTYHPFSIELSFGVGGHYINLENYTKDFATNTFPRLFELTGSMINTSTPSPITCNEYLYATASNRARALMVLPNDNGLFYPNYDILGSSNQFVDDNGVFVPGYITLRNMLPLTSALGEIDKESGNIVSSVLGPSPENLNNRVASGFTVFHRTKDNTSNQVVFFDISNLYYGKQILPNSLVLRDTFVSMSDGKISITLKDDGHGNIYRADSLTPHAKWNSVGNIFYNEGIVLLKNPSLYFFGKEQYNIEFRGVQDIHILTLNLIKKPLLAISSSNPEWSFLTGSSIDDKFVYISNINVHDEDLNVIMKATLSQPIKSKTTDKFLFKLKMDF